jgi:hypothetical protein
VNRCFLLLTGSGLPGDQSDDKLGRQVRFTLNVRDFVVFVATVGLFGCMMAVDFVIHIPDPDPVASTQPALIPGWKCPASRDIDHFVAVVNPPCSWIPGGPLVSSCRKELAEHQLLAFGCIRVPKVAVWYLMLPPLDADRRLSPNVPVKDWDIFKPYSTRPECETAIDALKPRHIDVAQERLALIQPVKGSRQDEVAAQAQYAQCASSDVARPDW